MTRWAARRPPGVRPHIRPEAGRRRPGEKWADLATLQKGHRVIFVLGRKSKRNAVAGINPDLIRQKRIGLFRLVVALRPDLRVPDFLSTGG